jgi:superfamily II DNA or RNA helicase
MEQAAYFGYSGERVKGLIFCSRIDEARELSRKFNEQGLRTIALSGADSEDVRAEAIERLTMDIQSEEDDYLDYIITVDIFSEGTDIVEVNQVIMLRPTQSPIVFIQQLGRGLRKASEKEYVVVLDFIGNYKNNFMIPIALSGDRSYNKDNIRRYLMEGGRVIPGASTIHFDEISRKRIFAAVDNANFSDIKLIKENYTNLKNKLGRIPRLRDFDDYGEMDVLRIFDNNNLGSYYKFLVKYEKEYKVRLKNRKLTGGEGKADNFPVLLMRIVNKENSEIIKNKPVRN